MLTIYKIRWSMLMMKNCLEKNLKKFGKIMTKDCSFSVFWV